MPLTASVLALTPETSKLEQTLQSIQPVADEILIFATETSGSIESVAAAFSANVFPLSKDRALVTVACEQANQPWVLFIHSGEQLDPNSHNELKTVIERSAERLFVHVQYPTLTLYRPRLLRAAAPQDENFAQEPLPAFSTEEFTHIQIIKNEASEETENPLNELTLLQLRGLGAPRQDAQNPKTHLTRALYYRLVQNDNDAEHHLQETLRLGNTEDPDHQPYILMAASLLGTFSLGANDPIEAERHCSTCLNLDDLYLDPWLCVGESYFLQDKLWMAEKALRRYLILCQQNAEKVPVSFAAQSPSARCPLQQTGHEAHATLLLGRLAEFRFDFTQARRHYEEALELGLKTWSLYAYLINMLEYHREQEKVLVILQQARAEIPDFDERIKEFSNDIPSTDQSPLGGSTGLVESRPQTTDSRPQTTDTEAPSAHPPTPPSAHPPTPLIVETHLPQQTAKKQGPGLLEYRPKFTFLNIAEMEALERDVLMPAAGLFHGCERVLDVGCDAGTFLRRLKDQKLVGFGIDEDPKLAEFCRHRGLDAESTTLTDMSGRGEQFDGIHLGHIIERHHQYEAEELLKDCLRLLKPGGLVVLRTANTNNSKVAEEFWNNYRHIRHYPLELAVQLLKDAGLDIVYAVEELFGVRDVVVVGRTNVERSTFNVQHSSEENEEQRTKNKERRTLHWSGSFFMPTGHSTMNRKLCSTLIPIFEGDITIQTDDHTYDFPQHPGFFPDLFTRMRTPTPPHSHTPTRLSSILHSHAHTLPHSHTILHSAWNYPTLPKAWQPHAADKNTHFWVASDHIRSGFIEDGVHEDRIAVVSPGFDEDVFHPAIDPLVDLNQHTRASFKFLFMGNTHPRHGLDLLVDAYVRGFTREDDVCLVIKEVLRPGEPRNEACLNKIRTVLQNFDAPEIIHMRVTLTEDGLAGLYTACDALVSPYRATDFPIAALEAMACACPVIVPKDGACAALSPPSRTGDDLVYWIETAGETPAATDTPTVRPARDILPSVESLQQQMRYVKENRDEARARAQLGCEYVRGRFTWEKIVNKLEYVIRNT